MSDPPRRARRARRDDGGRQPSAAAGHHTLIVALAVAIGLPLSAGTAYLTLRPLIGRHSAGPRDLIAAKERLRPLLGPARFDLVRSPLHDGSWFVIAVDRRTSGREFVESPRVTLDEHRTDRDASDYAADQGGVAWGRVTVTSPDERECRKLQEEVRAMLD